MFNPQVQVLIFPLFKMILYRIIEGLIPRKYALFMPEFNPQHRVYGSQRHRKQNCCPD